jgi:hypothetical protein
VTLALIILGGAATILVVLMAWGTWATRKPIKVNIDLDDRPDYYKRIEQELREAADNEDTSTPNPEPLDLTGDMTIPITIGGDEDG